jgi:tight adherence protein C
MQGKVTIEQLLALKLAFAAVAALWSLVRFASAPSLPNLLLAGVVVTLGWFGADAVVYSRAEERKKRMRRELADTMDQVTIAVEAGLGFEAALARVAESGRGVLAVELSRTLQDIRLGMPRAEALDAMADRADVAELRHFVAAIRQAERYGLPIATVLRVQASELRDKRRQAAEEHAMKIPVKVLFPLVLFILPTLFIVIIGPGVIQIIDGFSQR